MIGVYVSLGGCCFNPVAPHARAQTTATCTPISDSFGRGTMVYVALPTSVAMVAGNGNNFSNISALMTYRVLAVTY